MTIDKARKLFAWSFGLWGVLGLAKFLFKYTRFDQAYRDNIDLVSFPLLLVAFYLVIRYPAVMKPKMTGTPVSLGAVAPPLSGQWESDAKRLMSHGDKIGAIKLVRESTRLGLAEAKALVESWDAPPKGEWV